MRMTAHASTYLRSHMSQSLCIILYVNQKLVKIAMSIPWIKTYYLVWYCTYTSTNHHCSALRMKGSCTAKLKLHIIRAHVYVQSTQHSMRLVIAGMMYPTYHCNADVSKLLSTAVCQYTTCIVWKHLAGY